MSSLPGASPPPCRLEYPAALRPITGPLALSRRSSSTSVFLRTNSRMPWSLASRSGSSEAFPGARASPRGASSEAAITVVGPLTSLVIAGICYGLALAASTSSALALAADVLVWLAYINLTLAFFNLIPAFPLDGGRLLSSLLWWRSGSRKHSVQQAVRVGRLFVYGMILVGFVELFFGSFSTGSGSPSSAGSYCPLPLPRSRACRPTSCSRSVPVSAAMTSPVITVPDWLTVEQFLTSVAPSHPFTTCPLHNRDGTSTGWCGSANCSGTVGANSSTSDCATSLSRSPAVPRTRADEDLSAVLERVGATLGRRLLVYDGDRLVGIMSPADVTRLLMLRQAVQGRV